MPTTEEKRAYQRAHYHANKEMWRRKRQRYEAKMRAVILAAKDHPCTDCGGRWPAVIMEFDHGPEWSRSSTSAISTHGNTG
jgi:hypothetical protein